MTRNTDRTIEVKQYPPNEAFPTVPPNWYANLILETHSDADVSQGVQIIFHKSFEHEHQARSWAEQLDAMLLYGDIRFTRTYEL